MSTALITAIYDGYDGLRPLPDGVAVDDAICVTDDAALVGRGWRTVYEPRYDLPPVRAAKRPKCCPWWYTDADVTIWIDASYTVRSTKLDELADVVTALRPIAQFRHPDRDCIYSEAVFSMQMGKYAGEPIDAQAAYYRDVESFPVGWGLWAAGVIVRRYTATTETFGEMWLAEINRWSFQDQISEPYVLHACGLRPYVLDGDYGNNRWFQLSVSERHA